MSTVLYVEDGFDDRELMLKAVAKAKAKFELRLAEDYRGPVEYLSHQGFYENQEQFHLPDLVLLDYSLKGCNAPDLLEWIRARSKFARLPVVIFSGNIAKRVVADCYARGANYFIEKPARSDVLLEFVRMLDTCLGNSPIDIKPLKKFAVHPELARQHLKETMLESLAKGATLQKEQGKLRQHIDLLRAEQKELKRQSKFIPPDKRRELPTGLPPVYIQNRQTGRFLTSEGQWTEAQHYALSFTRLAVALTYCQQHGLADCDVVMDNGHPKLDVRIPYLPSS